MSVILHKKEGELVKPRCACFYQHATTTFDTVERIYERPMFISFIDFFLYYFLHNVHLLTVNFVKLCLHMTTCIHLETEKQRGWELYLKTCLCCALLLLSLYGTNVVCGNKNCFFLLRLSLLGEKMSVYHYYYEIVAVK